MTTTKTSRMGRSHGSNTSSSSSCSRYFVIQTPPTTRASISNATSSPHFLNSPSSVLGSIRSACNFLLSLLPPSTATAVEEEQDAIHLQNDDDDDDSQRNAKIQNVRRKQTCEDCYCYYSCSCAWKCNTTIRLLAQAAQRQFEHCSIFRQRFASKKKKKQQHAPCAYDDVKMSATAVNDDKRINTTSCSCCCDYEKEIIQTLQNSVRHLCAHGCYLRAFAPMREWHALRSTVISDDCWTDDTSSLDVLLEGWRCSLADEVPSQSVAVDSSELPRKKRKFTEEELQQQSRHEKKPLLQLVYVSPDGKTVKGRQNVLKAIGLSGNGHRSMKQDSPNIIPQSLDNRQFQGQYYTTLSTCKRTLHFSSCRTTAAAATTCSPFGLLEELFCHHPWRLLLCTIMLNRTTRRQVDVVLYWFLQRWPSATRASKANEMEVATVIAPLGLRYKRARGIIRFSQQWLQLLERKRVDNDDNNNNNEARVSDDDDDDDNDNDEAAFALSREDVLGLYNCGDYAYDAYRIFVQGMSTDVITTDHALQIYVDYHRGLDKTTTTTTTGHSK